MDFKAILLAAKNGNDEAIIQLLLMYRPLLLKEAIMDGVFDEDLYQDFCIVFLRCVRSFHT